MTGRGRHADRPVTGAAHVSSASLLEGLKGADLVALVVDLPVGRLHKLAELVVEPLGLEVSLLLGHPFLQAEMGLDDEPCHGAVSSLVAFLLSSLSTAQNVSVSSSPRSCRLSSPRPPAARGSS